MKRVPLCFLERLAQKIVVLSNIRILKQTRERSRGRFSKGKKERKRRREWSALISVKTS
jgi:hypothetical protein